MPTRPVIAVVALLLAACGQLAAPASGPVTGPTTSPTPPPADARGGIEFVLEDTYAVGDRVDVGIRNTTDRAFKYNPSYQACDLTYRDEDGREFIIPPGTHCDLQTFIEIAPGETVTLFTWDLDECVKDDWGCVKSEPLPPGRYTIEGTFRAVGGGAPSHAETAFEIVG